MNPEDNNTILSEQDQIEETRSQPIGPIVVGLLIILLGIILLVARLIGKDLMSEFWPFLFIAGGLIFYAVYFIRLKKPAGSEGLLFPGTYLIVMGVLFLILNLLGWRYIGYLWPTFILGVPLALGSMYIFGSKEQIQKRKDLLSSIQVLVTISVVLFVIAAGGLYLWPLALIIIGIIIIAKAFSKK